MVEATLRIPLKKEDIDKMADIVIKLSELGVTFDTGYDGSEYDWILDWSLKGAELK